MIVVVLIHKLNAFILFQRKLDLLLQFLAMNLGVETLLQRKLVYLRRILAILISNGYTAVPIELLWLLSHLQVRNRIDFIIVGKKLAAVFVVSQKLALHADVLEVQVHVTGVVAISTQYGMLARFLKPRVRIHLGLMFR
jgi:hypothetical protein